MVQFVQRRIGLETHKNQQGFAASKEPGFYLEEEQGIVSESCQQLESKGFRTPQI